jgi:signal transduction histidine kinase
MTSLIDDLLMYSRVGRKDEPWEAFDLHGVIKEAQDNLSEQFQATKAQITTSSLPHIFGDRTQFVLLMQNLISNSLKYRHPDRTPEITITASIDDQYLRLVVEDNGIGFEMQYQDRIFQIFERLHSRSQVAGTGIGLALCKKIVERHRGEISAVGTPDKGAVFTIRLPVEALHVS